MAKFPLLIGLVACLTLGAPLALSREAPSAEMPPLTEVSALGLAFEEDAPVIRAIARGSPAARGGLRVRDRILEVGGETLGGSCGEAVRAIIAQAREAGGDAVSLSFLVERGEARESVEFSVTFRELDAVVAVNRALDFLARELTADPEYQESPPRSFYAPIIYAPLAGLAFLANGSTRLEGRHAAGLRLVLPYVMKHGGRRKANQDEINKAVGGNICSLTHNAGYSAMFLAQLIDSEFPKRARRSRTRSRGPRIRLAFTESRIRKKLRECATTLEKLALPNGGWQHGSGGRNMLGYTHLTAATITAMNGLLMAKQVGIKVDRGVLERGFGYLRKATSDGEVGYAVGNRGSFSAGRNAGTLQCLVRGGFGEDELVAPVLAKLLANLEKAGIGHGSPIWHLFNVSLATAHLSPDGRERFLSLYQQRLLANQQADGSLRAFDPLGSAPGKGEENRVWGALYTTPLIALALLAPYRQDLLLVDFDR